MCTFMQQYQCTFICQYFYMFTTKRRNSALGLVAYVHSDINFERSVSESGPIKYVPLFDNISRYLLLRRNPDFEVN